MKWYGKVLGYDGHTNLIAIMMSILFVYTLIDHIVDVKNLIQNAKYFYFNNSVKRTTSKTSSHPMNNLATFLRNIHL